MECVTRHLGFLQMSGLLLEVCSQMSIFGSQIQMLSSHLNDFQVFWWLSFNSTCPFVSADVTSHPYTWTLCHPTLDSTSICRRSDSQLRFLCFSAGMALWGVNASIVLYLSFVPPCREARFSSGHWHTYCWQLHCQHQYKKEGDGRRRGAYHGVKFEL